ncbi:hypothetical protein SpCBS45565_g03097 [Spizellomyces sp. 'palustris']|nr:hypothetical protein SpCBS45565_g03097 [Spizellomyces sp. 'palustris']
MTQQQRAQAAANMNISKDERIEQLTNKVLELEEKLAKVHESYNLLWSETVACRLLQSKHHQVITNITSFLASIYREDGDNTSRKRKFDVDILQAEVAKISPQDTKSNPLPSIDRHMHPRSSPPLIEDHGLQSETESAYEEYDEYAEDMVQVSPPASKRLRTMV